MTERRLAVTAGTAARPSRPGRRRPQRIRLDRDRGDRPIRTRLTPPPRRRRDHEDRADPASTRRLERGTGRTPCASDSRSVHASLITGGREESTIPERCVLTVERRTLPGESVTDVEADIAELLRRCRDADAELNVAARTTLAREPFEVSADELIVAAEQHAVAGVADPTPGRRQLLGRLRVHRPATSNGRTSPEPSNAPAYSRQSPRPSARDTSRRPQPRC